MSKRHSSSVFVQSGLQAPAAPFLSALFAIVFVALSSAAAVAAQVGESPWRIDGELQLEYDSERDFNLDKSDDEDEATLEPELDLNIAFQPSLLFQAFLRFELSRKYGVSGPDAETGETRLDLTQAYLASEGIALTDDAELSLYVGRQNFSDDRQWLYDEQLDGVTMLFTRRAWSLALSAVRYRDQDLLNDRPMDEPMDYIAYGRYEFEDQVLGAYLFQQKARDGSDEDPLFIGIQSSGDMGSNANYWLQLAMVRGHDGATDLRGWGFDVGVTYAFDLPLSPWLILGYAYGSGDDNDSDGVDHAFRQTGLHDNEEDLGGLAGFHYLGAMMEPELSNIQVATIGFGIHPVEQVSTLIALHHYRQDDALADLDGNNIDTDPDGEHADLGYGVDWVTGMEFGDATTFETVVGYFHPGSAFDADSDDAWYVELKLEYEF